MFAAADVRHAAALSVCRCRAWVRVVCSAAL